MKKIIVAGAGHGGLVAAAKLAKHGFQVTVYEKLAENELGHDWEDRFSLDLLQKYADIDTKLSWRYTEHCTFMGPSENTKIVFDDSKGKRHHVLWRKPIINMLVEKAKNNGVEFVFNANITAPICENDKVLGIVVNSEKIYGDLVIDSCGVFSPIRMNLPDSCMIEQKPKKGDIFYAYRAYYENLDPSQKGEAAFEIYLCHRGEPGLSWCSASDDFVDILIGRTDELTKDKINELVGIFKKQHPYIGDNILHGGTVGAIPVRRSLPVMVCDGYAAVGDSAFMTTPMNGMGIDLSVKAGALLSDTVIKHNGECDKYKLWDYNRDFHILYGGDTARNEGLKNTLISIPSQAVDFYFDASIIEHSELDGAGNTTSLSSLIGKLVRGMKKPKWFFMLLTGLIKGTKMSKIYKSIPEKYDAQGIKNWVEKINSVKVNVNS